MVDRVRTGGPLPPTPVATPPPDRTPAPTTGPIPPRTTATPAVAPLPTSSPIQIMDWQARLGQGDENATTREVQNNELVAHQLNQLTAGGSQYITQAEDAAREEASSRGMMMSTMAAGAGRRAAIDAALPIATADATTYGRTASENMAARNADSLADQQMWGQLTGQEVGIRANLDESERGRGFTARENQLQRQWQTGERVAGQTWQTGERVGAQNFQNIQRIGTQAFQAQQQSLQNAWQGAQNNAQRTTELALQERNMAHQMAMQTLQNAFQGNQQALQLAQQRFLSFENSMANQNAQLSQTIASIYNNPNLTAAQQQAAVANARAVYQSMFTSYAQSLAGGVPQIFWNPYPMAARPAGATVPTTGGNLPPAPAGTQTPSVQPPGGIGPAERLAFMNNLRV